MKLKKNIAVSESGLLFNHVTGESFTINPIGIEILKLIREEKSMEDILKAIMERYSIDRATVEKDYHDFIGILYNHNLIDTHEETND
jgi:hypothetical protein